MFYISSWIAYSPEKDKGFIQTTVTALRNLQMLGKLCGSESARRLIFVTTMWDKIPTDRGEERALQNRYFKPMLHLGAGTARFDNTSVSAWKIISQLLEKGKAILIQEEMVDVGRDLPETAAAAEVLLSGLQNLIASHKQTIKALKREAGKVNNQEVVADLNKEITVVEKRLEKTFMEAQQLRIPLSRRISYPSQSRYYAPLVVNNINVTNYLSSYRRTSNLAWSSKSSYQYRLGHINANSLSQLGKPIIHNTRSTFNVHD